MRERTEKMRYERKFYLPRGSVSEAVMVLRLQPAFFRPAYEPRRVNNIYFDTWDMRDREEHWASFSQRQKVRIRWYGDEEQARQPCLEIKHKQGEVGHKYEFSLPDFIPDSIPDGIRYENWLSSLNLPMDTRKWIIGRRPVLFNSYLREYWRSASGDFRVTIDSVIVARLIKAGLAPGFKKVSFPGVIIELKYNREKHINALAQIGCHWPWRPIRFSKYMMALERWDSN